MSYGGILRELAGFRGNRRESAEGESKVVSNENELQESKVVSISAGRGV